MRERQTKRERERGTDKEREAEADEKREAERKRERKRERPVTFWMPFDLGEGDGGVARGLPFPRHREEQPVVVVARGSASLPQKIEWLQLPAR